MKGLVNIFGTKKKFNSPPANFGQLKLPLCDVMVMVLSFPGLSFLASYLGLTSDINGHRIIRPSR